MIVLNRIEYSTEFHLIFFTKNYYFYTQPTFTFYYNLINKGVLEIIYYLEDSINHYGFLRYSNYLASTKDIYVSKYQILLFGLKTGDTVKGKVRNTKNTKEKYFPLIKIIEINNSDHP